MVKLQKLPHINFKHFCYTLGVVPTSYLDTMTDLELKLWLIKFLCEHVIPVINDNSEAVKELQELFLKLQNYVNNYFDNLDVQEEINTKLDEMAENGTLDEIINKYINNTFLRYYKTVNNMKNDESLQQGQIVKTQGFYEINDNGGASYIIKENLNPNESNIIALKNGLFAEFIQTSNNINVAQFGCKEDGTTDTSDNLQNLLNYCENNNYPSIFGNNKKLLINKTIYIPAYCKLENIYFTAGNNVSNYKNNYMLMINYNIQTDNWKIEYPQAFQGQMKNCTLENNNTSIKLNGIYNCSNNIFVNITTHGLNISFKSARNYLDCVVLNKFYISSKTFDDYAIDFGYLGDACKIENSHIYNTLGTANYILTNGGHHSVDIKNIINNGKITINGDTANITNLHGEEENSIIEINNANVSIENAYLIHHVNPNLQITNSAITLKNIMFCYEMLINSFENTSDIDVQIDNKTSLILENCYKQLRANDIAEKILFKPKVSTDSFPKINILRSIDTKNQITENLTNLDYHGIAVAYPGKSEKCNWFAPSGTYYYHVLGILDYERKLRYSNYYYETSNTNTNGSNGFKFSSVTNGLYCIYRGTQENVYDKKANISVCSGVIHDSGLIINGIKWENNQSNNVENYNNWYNDIKYIGKNIITRAGGLPQYGNWLKGDIIINTNPTSATENAIAWICTEDGNPGTWKILSKLTN